MASEDCAECCDQALPTVTVYVRSFHPNSFFEETDHFLGRRMGGPWGGDSRGFSLDIDDTSRVMHRYSVNLASFDTHLGAVHLRSTGSGQWSVQSTPPPPFRSWVRPVASSDPSHALGSDVVATYPAAVTRLIDMVQTSPHGRLYEHSGPNAHPERRVTSGGWHLLSTRVPDVKLVRGDVLLNQRCRKSFTIVTHHFGVNTAIGFMTENMAGDFVPDLDVFAKVNFDIDKTNGVLGIDAAVFGDQFPNCEAFIVDGRGRAVYLGASVRIGYPISSTGGSTLRGVNTRPMFTSDIEIKLDDAGHFQSFKSGASFDGWNRRIAGLDPNGRSHSTRFRQQ